MIDGTPRPPDAATGSALRSPGWTWRDTGFSVGIGGVCLMGGGLTYALLNPPPPVLVLDAKPAASLPTASPTPACGAAGNPCVYVEATAPPTATPEPRPTKAPTPPIPRCRAGEAVPGGVCREPYPVPTMPAPTPVPPYPIAGSPEPGSLYVWRGP